jgi:non-heme chloroperoxidase
MVMLHGVTNWWRSFEGAMPVLGARWTVNALDLRGHGHSSRVDNGYRWSEFAKDAVAFLQESQEEPAIVVGHSMGANVAIEVAARAPELVKALILEEPLLYSHRGERQRALLFFPFLKGYERIARAGGSADEMLPALAELHKAPDPEVLRGKANSLSLMDPNVLSMWIDGVATEEFDTDELLQRITCPTLLIVGESSLGGANNSDDVAGASAQLARATVLPVSGLGHWVLRERPQEYCEAVIRYLDSL